tara:strand:+ start:421 stop:1038 length:618 start_codon:yes stop_codon:yes gene_type:complete
MKVSEARAAVGGLSVPSKMPCYSFGISADHCKTGSKLAKIEGSICNTCYAQKGLYKLPSTEAAQERRINLIGTSNWVDNMVRAINNADYFRWFDSGDLQSDEMLADIVRVALATPDTKHWLPTHENFMVSRYLRKHGKFPSNLTVRVSAAMVDGEPPKRFALTSTVHQLGKPIGRECPSSKQGNKCADCRACWNPRIKNISYKYH